LGLPESWGQTKKQQEATVIVEGRGTIIKGDKAQARDEAITDMRRRAIEKVTGVFLHSQTMIEDHLLLRHHLYTQTSGVVLGEKITREWHQDGIYYVKGQVRISTNNVRNRLIKVVQKERVIVITSEQIQGHPVQPQQIEPQVIKTLLDAGFKKVIDSQSLSRKGRHKLLKLMRKGELQRARNMGLSYLADNIVYAEASTATSQKIHKGYYSAKANGNVKMIQIRTKNIVLSESVLESKGFGTTRQQANINALQELSKQLTQRLMQHLKPQGSAQKISVTFYGIADYNQYNLYRELLSKLRFVTEVKPDAHGYNQNKTVFYIYHNGKWEYIVSRLSQDTKLKITRSNPTEIEIRMIHK
jgi:hypothetical protein